MTVAELDIATTAVSLRKNMSPTTMATIHVEE
ncbi:hypothetical protein LINGRAHAP2_LOCUS20116 [Linum grandiflorum]